MVLLANRRSVMTLYSDGVDAASHAVRFVLAEKAINVEVHNVFDEPPPEDLNDLNPYNTILTLVDRELVLYEGQIIMEYLDERFPHPPLMPVDPVARASNRLYRYRIGRDIYRLLETLDAGGKKVGDARTQLRDQLTTIAPVFTQKPFFMSEDYSLVDCYLAPVLWRLEHYDIQLPSQAKSLLQYAERLFSREAFAASLTEPEQEMREA
ncbi:MAG: stringent starvation protein A [Gammaproteobacteria bacterium]|nr:MAG: stringent starvation protein A [Gammaproteobacteria bacterium]